MCVCVWPPQTETVEEDIVEEEEDAAEEADTTEEDSVEDEEDGVVEEDEKEEKPKTKMVEKTTWDWVLVNDTKPIWLRRWVGHGLREERASE